MSPRSYRVAPDKVEVVKSFFNKLPKSRESLAEEVEIDKDTLINFLMGRPVQKRIFLRICDFYGLPWKDLADGVTPIPTNFLRSGISEATQSGGLSSPGTSVQKFQRFALPEKIAPVRYWVGRSQELDTLKTKLLDSNTRAITITAVCVVGLAGIGKTTLASQVVRQLRTEENTPFIAAAWESLRSATGKPPRFDSVIDSLLSTISNGEITSGVIVVDDYIKKTERLIALLKEKSCLVVLDNIETVLKVKQAHQAGYFADDCAEYAWLFQQLTETHHQSKVIFTSRESVAQLQRRGTHTLQLGGLDQNSAIRLLESFELVATSEELKELAKRYEGHPKALEIVSAVIQEEFQRQAGSFLRDRKWLLIRDIESLIDEVVNRLSEEEYTCLSQISIYQTTEYPLSYEGIAAQMPEVSERHLKENVILALKRRQLLDFSCEHNSFQMHPFVQEKASYLLDSESYYKAHQQAYNYFLNIAGIESEWKEISDVQPALRAYHHACAIEEWNNAGEVIIKVYEFLRLGSNFDLIFDLCSRLIPENWRNGNQLVSSPGLHVDILFSLGYACCFLRDYKSAEDYLQQGLLISQKNQDHKRMAKILCYIGLANLENPTLACKHLQESLRVSTITENDSIKCRSLEFLGIAHQKLGNFQTSLNYFTQSLEVARKAEFQEGEAIALGNIGNVYRDLKEYETSISYTKQYYEIACKIDNIKYIEYSLLSLSEGYNSVGDYHNAIKYGEECLKAARNSFDRIMEIWAMSSIGIAYRGLGKYQKAIDVFNKCLEISRKTNSTENEAGSLYSLGITIKELGKLEEAAEFFESSLSIYNEISHHQRRALVLLELVKIHNLIKPVSREIIQIYLRQAEKICLDLDLPLMDEIQRWKTSFFNET